MLVIPFALPYARTHKRFSDFQRPLSETLLYNARIGDYRNVLPESILYGAGNRFVHVAGIGYERVLYPGLCILYLALMALVLRRRDYEGWTEQDAAGRGRRRRWRLSAREGAGRHRAGQCGLAGPRALPGHSGGLLPARLRPGHRGP